MNKWFHTIALLLLSTVLFAQTTITPDGYNGAIRFKNGGSSVDKVYLAENGFLGIGTSSPRSFLDIIGNHETVSSSFDARFFLKLKNTSNLYNSGVIMQLESGSGSSITALSHHAPSYYFPNLTENFADFGQLVSYGPGLILRAGSLSNTQGIIKFITADNEGLPRERMRLAANGNFGVGVKIPSAKIHVENGDVYIGTPYNGLIMKSPSGNCFKITVNDNGSLSTNYISCP